MLEVPNSLKLGYPLIVLIRKAIQMTVFSLTISSATLYRTEFHFYNLKLVAPSINAIIRTWAEVNCQLTNMTI